MTSSRTTSLSVRLPNDLHAWLKAEAKRRGIPMSWVVTQAVTTQRRHDAEHNETTREADDGDT